jgi:DNA polymerase
MADNYHELLNATIQHLEELKARGRRFVSVSPDALAALHRAPQKRPSQSSPPPPPKAVAHAPAKVQSTNTKSAERDPIEEPAQTPAAATSTLGPQAKAAAFAELRERALACMKCANLVSSRKHVVFGVGNINAELMFIGEANILKCRPDTPGQSAGNRKPTPEEMQTCIPYLHEQIDLIGPKVIVALGATAVEGLLGKTIGISRLRGQWRTYRGIPLMPTYHPAYLLRNQALSEKRRVWEDMLQVMQKLGMSLSERQKNYFLKAAS